MDRRGSQQPSRPREPDPSVAIGDDEDVTCPYCGSSDTTRMHPKGPSLCRSMHYCRDCEEPFEAMRD